VLDGELEAFLLPSLAQLDGAAGTTRIWLATTPADMRCGFDRLADLAMLVTEQDPRGGAGHLFLFRSRGGDRLKALYWDRDGYALWYKRLEVGVFKFPKIVACPRRTSPRRPGSRGPRHRCRTSRRGCGSPRSSSPGRSGAWRN
jgi:transposase